jgi:hypothetical protein
MPPPNHHQNHGRQQRVIPRANKPDDQDQSKAFIEKAREIGADEEKSAADGLIGRLAKKPPEPHKKKARD